MSRELKLARMLAEGLAASLSSASKELFDAALAEGMDPALVAGLHGALGAFSALASEAAVARLLAQVHGEVRDGLARLDRERTDG